MTAKKPSSARSVIWPRRRNSRMQAGDARRGRREGKLRREQNGVVGIEAEQEKADQRHIHPANADLALRHGGIVACGRSPCRFRLSRQSSGTKVIAALPRRNVTCAPIPPVYHCRHRLTRDLGVAA